MRKAALLGGLSFLALSQSSDHNDFRADLHAVVEIDHVLVAHADAARGHRGADRPRLVGAMNAIERRAEIERARAERIFRAASHVGRQIRAAPEHLRWRTPVRPLTLERDLLDAGPGEARPPDADAVAHRRAIALDEIKESLTRIDDDGARRLASAVFDHLLLVARIHGRTCRCAVLVRTVGCGRLAVG